MPPPGRHRCSSSWVGTSFLLNCLAVVPTVTDQPRSKYATIRLVTSGGRTERVVRRLDGHLQSRAEGGGDCREPIGGEREAGCERSPGRPAVPPSTALRIGASSRRSDAAQAVRCRQGTPRTSASRRPPPTRATPVYRVERATSNNGRVRRDWRKRGEHSDGVGAADEIAPTIGDDACQNRASWNAPTNTGCSARRARLVLDRMADGEHGALGEHDRSHVRQRRASVANSDERCSPCAPGPCRARLRASTRRAALVRFP